MSIHQFRNTISISRKYIVKPYSIDDVCYTIYKMFKDKAISIAYEKPFCNHIFITGNNFEARVFVNMSNEVHFSILMDINEIFSSAIKNIQKIFSEIDKAFLKLSNNTSNICIMLRVSLRVGKIDPETITRILSDLGIVVYIKEIHTVSGIDIVVIRGKTVGKNLGHYDITITMLYNGNYSSSEVSFSVEADVGDDKILDRLVELQYILYTITECIVFNIDQKNKIKERY